MALHLMGAVIGDISGSWYKFRDFKNGQSSWSPNGFLYR